MNTNKISALGRFFSKIFNIAPHEVPRTLSAWSLRFCFQVGLTIGWTMLTAMFVGRLGIEHLPLLFIANAGLVILSTIFFNSIINRVSRNTLVYSTIACGIVLLTTAILGFNVTGSLRLFFGLALIAESVFFAQLNILLGLFIEELFSPLESSRAFPLIETSEHIGGIAGGFMILGALRFLDFTAPQLAFLWLGVIILILPIIFLFNVYRKKLPILKTSAENRKPKSKSRLKTMLKSGKQIRRIPFLTGLVFVVLLQWTFFTMLNFQYTKAVDANVAHSQTIADGHGSALSEHHQHEELLTHGLSKLHIIFSLIALFTQFFLTSRIIGKLGIVRSLRIHPLISILSTCGMMLKFGFGSAVAAKALFESTSGIYNAAYHSSFYAVREKVRRHAKEFLEGLIRPLGIIVGTSAIFALQQIFTGSNLTFAINSILLLSALVMSFVLWRAREHYTKISEKNLDLTDDNLTKLNSVEILTQSGHKNASHILIKNLLSNKRSENLKVKILGALGKIQDSKTIPTILSFLKDESQKIKIAAVNALSEFKELSKDYSQAFTHQLVIDSLKKLFERENSQEIRSAVVNVFTKIQHNEIVPFLLDKLEQSNDLVRANCIHACGLFGDISAAHYIEPHLESKNPYIRASSIIALWQFPQYRLRLTSLLAELLEAQDKKTKKVSVHTIGEIKAVQEKTRLLQFLEQHDEELQLLSAVALSKLEHEKAPHIIAEFVLHENEKLAEKTRRHMQHIPEKHQRKVEKIVHHKLSHRLHQIITESKAMSLNDFSQEKLKELRFIYAAAKDWEEVERIDKLLDSYQLTH